MIETLGKADVIIKSATSGSINLLEDEEFKLLKELIGTAANN
ncbi:hypothetical protein SAMN05428642_102241 [Flaviramulus basaltis]|uniref:Uncharacterized protein n=1 Tax=Flaviramulus basaltis TaxID=369401 RepID=A0A1K2IH45_9FLAO|nr:hypothetical protein [Flaviramulus basaltis]SFZ91703.1 hypothetical protein SAMN05428642_102241 [Flaviramulus basaltis]